MYEEVFYEADVPTLIKLAKEGFDGDNISAIYKSPKNAQTHAIKSLKEKCNNMIKEKELGIKNRLAEKENLNKLIEAGKGYLTGASGVGLLDEDRVGVMENDLTRLDSEISSLSEELGLLKTKRFQIPSM